MMNGREEILARIRTALGDRPTPPEIRRTYRTAEFSGGRTADGATDRVASETEGRTATELADLLVDRITDYRATVRRCRTPELADTIAAALRDRGARRVAVPTGLDQQWLSAVSSTELVPDDPPLTPAELDALDGVLTTCAVAVAETGTIVLDAGPGQGRRAVTLVPDYHLVVVAPEAVVDDVPAAVARLDPTRPLTWISGPSATSDIELDRVEGVHGPRTLEVILVDDAQQ